TLLSRRHSASSLFPYTTLFRSILGVRRADAELNVGGKGVAAVAAHSSKQLGPLAGGVIAGVIPRHGHVAGSLVHGDGRLEMAGRSEEHTSELQSHLNLVCRLLL